MSVKIRKGDKPTASPASGEAGAPTPVPTGNPLHPMMGFKNEIDRLFDSFMGGGFPGLFGRSPFDLPAFRPFERMMAPLAVVQPKVDVVETEKEFRVTAELPGMGEDDVEVTVADGMLRLKGEKKVERDDKQGDYHVTERHYGSFQRSFTIPESVKDDAIKAEFAKGVLTIVLPKSETAKKPARTIKVDGK